MGDGMPAGAKSGQGARKLVIAIDGPAGSGKSTLAALLARRYNYTNIETGAMYRALAFKALEDGVPLDDEKKLAALAAQSRIKLAPDPEGNRVLLDGNDVTECLRSQEVTDAASKVSVHPAVREWMVAAQRKIGACGGIVMEGRDIGTKVFPDAEVKIFLDAAPEIRGTRRFLQSPASSAHEASVVAELQARDQRDRTRANSPLAPAPDAVLIDSTYLTLDQVLARAVEVIDASLATK
ncbi:MAG TPA: (d)CMP kinase [Candidatus Angelobacter sp.]|jgi:cytidylate kinase|nr:(d)CMP kinase [Candidatus Angelobacter sp.]